WNEEAFGFAAAATASASLDEVAERGGWALPCARAAALVREVLGNPFRPAGCEPAWRTETALALARRVYDERAFERLPILADALEDAGCDGAGLLAHLRGGGDHVRGCWALDLVLGLA